MRYASVYEYIFQINPSNSQQSAILSLERDPPALPVIPSKVDAGVVRFINASALASDGKYHEAEEEFANAVLLSPQLSLARYQLGFLQFLRGRMAQAQLIWQPLLNPVPRTAESDTLASFVEGFSALASGELNQALALFQMGLTYGFDNQPLLDDARKIIDRIESAIRAANPGYAASANETTGEAASTNAHVLLNGYLNPRH